MKHEQSIAGELGGSEAQQAASSVPAGGLTPAMTLLLAVAAGLSVANIYFVQPLLDAVAREFRVSAEAIGIVVTVTQLGYAAGLILIVPLGDFFNRRRMVAGQGFLSVAALLLAALAPSLPLLLGALVVVGLLAVAVQVLVAFAATLAGPGGGGRAVGKVTSGIVIGILLARFISGALADMGGWRSVYLASAAAMLVMSALLLRVLPDEAKTERPSSYPALLRSMLLLFVEEPLLRVRALLALLIFAAFSIFWTSMVLPLSAPPLSLSSTQVGLFGLIGIAGSLAAGSAGRLADEGRGQRTTGMALAVLLLAWLPLSFLDLSLLWLMVGVVLLDLAVQAVHVTNQSMLFAVRPEARSRIVGGYMVFYSIGSGLGAISSTTAYGHAGWAGVCTLGAAVSLLAWGFWLATRRLGQGPSPAASEA
ncbi:MFS transporter [Pyxidicoccus fallax]|uniref:MFS transporter n=1 Tax=Pyxidicoccus fallax TaxID=394095 RepID=A0A848LIL5_9BACT|nr:MFS transporter [Pyxidicoccus fallax]NMO17562.1 MFS transporter [Pyxidicoccus fallax]NPC82910.1 MFS transporter [Pyxidicoccus fallax]